MKKQELEIMISEYDDSPVDWNKVKSSLRFINDSLNIDYKRNLVGALIITGRTKLYFQQRENINKESLKKVTTLESLLEGRLLSESFESIKKIKL